MEYITAYKERRELTAYMLYNTAACIKNMLFSGNKVSPSAAFPGVINEPEPMDDNALYAACLAWTGGIEEDVCKQGD